jgi:hypothetical protein
MSGVSETSYFYRPIGGSEVGPVPLGGMADLIAAGRVSGITQVREDGCYLWRYASDLPELHRLLEPRTGSAEPPIESKRLAELTVGDVPKVIEPYVRILTNCGFFVNYVTISLQIVFAAGHFILMVDGVTELTLPFGSGFLIAAVLALVLWAVWVCVVPLAIWINYHKRRLRWVQFFFAEFAAYVVPTVALAFAFWIAEHSLWRLLFAAWPRYSAAAF